MSIREHLKWFPFKQRQSQRDMSILSTTSFQLHHCLYKQSSLPFNIHEHNFCLGMISMKKVLPFFTLSQEWNIKISCLIMLNRDLWNKDEVRATSACVCVLLPMNNTHDWFKHCFFMHHSFQQRKAKKSFNKRWEVLLKTHVLLCHVSFVWQTALLFT